MEYTYFDLMELYKYIDLKTNCDTYMSTNGEIFNENFQYIKMVGDWLIIRHKNDNRNSAIQYKTNRGAMNYCRKWLERIGD